MCAKGFLINSDMFDWHDEELTNIIWGGESDHLVPFPDSKESGASSSHVEGWRNFFKNESQSMQSESISRAEGARVDKDSGIFRKPGKNHENLAECHWDGSFDDLPVYDLPICDLDQILSNDDLIFGNVNLGNTDELWSNSKNAGSSFDLEESREVSESFEIKEEYLQEDDRDFTLGYDDHTIGEGNYSADQKLQIRNVNDIATRPHASPQRSAFEKGFKQRNRRKTEKNDLPFQKNHRINKFTQQPRHAPDTPRVHTQCASIPCRVTNGTLTPQEKIEKLRKRQQMQAMLAIQRQQQQQFGSLENTIHQNEIDDLNSFPRFDHFSSNEQDDSITVDDYSAEDAIFYNLQEVVAKLDVRVRLCLRDSLYRLAQSATQRHAAFEASSSSGQALSEEIHGRDVGMPEAETESNPIDRTVAHLLFHRTAESVGKRDTPGCNIRVGVSRNVYE